VCASSKLGASNSSRFEKLQMKTNFAREVSYKATKIYKKQKHIKVTGCFRDKGTLNAKLFCVCQMAYGEVEV